LDLFLEVLLCGLRRWWIHVSGLLIRRLRSLTEPIVWFFLVLGHGSHSAFEFTPSLTHSKGSACEHPYSSVDFNAGRCQFRPRGAEPLHAIFREELAALLAMDEHRAQAAQACEAGQARVGDLGHAECPLFEPVEFRYFSQDLGRSRRVKLHGYHRPEIVRAEQVEAKGKGTKRLQDDLGPAGS
jgi:hypothetical protein